ncbi:MAG: DUF72 domain-containing protein [Pseudomonadota bacterium]
MATKNSVQRSGRIFIGTGGWSFAPWRGEFYPAGLAQSRELAYMSARLNSIEINSTFYGPQKPATFQRWHDETPADFVFAVKGPMSVSNRRDLADSRAGIERFLDGGVLNLARKLGPVNWQLSPGKRFAAAEIDGFLSSLPAERDGRKLRHAIEVRHASFAAPEFILLAQRHGVAIVLAGDSGYPQIANPTASFCYLRIMGTADDETKGYPAAMLTRWAQRARTLALGDTPTGLELTPGVAAIKPQRRDVFLYVISGAKRRNPAAAVALLARLSR